MKDSATRRNIFFFLLLFVTSGLSLIALVIPQVAPFSASSLQAGQVVTQDMLAPADISFESEILTQQQRDAAARSVPNIYTVPDTSVARRQLEDLRAALAFITNVRADPHATPAQRLSDLAALENVHLDTQTATLLLSLNDQRWQAVQQESIVVLEQVMRTTIREDRLEDALRSIPALVSLALSEDQAVLVSRLVSAFVIPNSFYSEELTQAARQKAQEAVNPVVRSFKMGEVVVQRGQVLSETSREALEKLGLIQTRFDWKDLASAAALVFLGIGFTLFYLRRNTRLLKDTRALTLIAILFLVFLVSARLVIRSNSLLAYIFPLAAFGLTTSALFGAEPALVSMLSLSILTAYGLPNSLDLTLYYTLSTFFGILTQGRGRRMAAFFRAGAVVAACGALIAGAYRLQQPNAGWLELATLAGASLLNGVASAGITVLLQTFLAQFLGMTTPLQLLEISRPDHPLLQMILRSVPGTYQHSLQVANLAEQAAERIHADALLTRVGALYHDVGKALSPLHYIENQPPGGENPHDSLDPADSAAIIIRHVTDGAQLARKYRLPGRIIDFILEHHGTMTAKYQYVRAVRAAGGDESQVDQDLFRYPGPRPRSRETAILMLADGSEAQVRAARPKDEDALRQIIRSMVQERIALGQLDETNLTLRDLDLIIDSFSVTLRGMYHPRLEYPRLEKSVGISLDSTPTVPVAARQEPAALNPSDPPIHPSEAS